MARSFDTTHYLTVNDSAIVEMSTTFTWMLYIKTTMTNAVHGNRVIMEKRGSSSSGISWQGYNNLASTSWHVNIGGTNSASRTSATENSFNDGAWHASAFSIGGADDTGLFYIDGTDRTSLNDVGSPSWSTEVFYIGGRGGTIGLVGELFRAVLWKGTALNATQLKGLTNGVNPIAIGADITSWWELWGDDSTEPDYSGAQLGAANTSSTKSAPNPATEHMENYI